MVMAAIEGKAAAAAAVYAGLATSPIKPPATSPAGPVPDYSKEIAKALSKTKRGKRAAKKQAVEAGPAGAGQPGSGRKITRGVLSGTKVVPDMAAPAEGPMSPLAVTGPRAPSPASAKSVAARHLRPKQATPGGAVPGPEAALPAQPQPGPVTNEAHSFLEL